MTPHPFFRRRDDDVCCQVPITFVQAALGAEVVVPTLEGKGKLRVPPGTQPGSLLRIRGKGIPRKVGIGRGATSRSRSPSRSPPSSPLDSAADGAAGEELGEEVQPIQKTFVEKLRDLFG